MRLAWIERMRCITLAIERKPALTAGDGRRFLPSQVSIHRALRARKMGARNTLLPDWRKPEPIRGVPLRSCAVAAGRQVPARPRGHIE
jgi:hypothetical protein